MDTNTLRNRIEAKEKAIEKKQNTLEKHIDKTMKWVREIRKAVPEYNVGEKVGIVALQEKGFSRETATEIGYKSFDVIHKLEDARRTVNTIKEYKATLEKYNRQLAEELEKESKLESFPNSLYEELVDAFIKSNEDVKEEEIRKYVRFLVLDLVNRVESKVGEIKDWNWLHLQNGAYHPVLNGKVVGNKGVAYVETITAGGYNVQKFHLRTLVK